MTHCLLYDRMFVHHLPLPESLTKLQNLYLFTSCVDLKWLEKCYQLLITSHRISVKSAFQQLQSFDTQMSLLLYLTCVETKNKTWFNSWPIFSGISWPSTESLTLALVTSKPAKKTKHVNHTSLELRYTFLVTRSNISPLLVETSRLSPPPAHRTTEHRDIKRYWD